MGSKKTKYTQEFKKEAVKLVTEQNYNQTEAARRLGINAKNLSRWIKEAEEMSRETGKTKKPVKAEQEELLALRKEVKRLRMEREILKNVWSALFLQALILITYRRFASMYSAYNEHSFSCSGHDRVRTL